jgi:peroxiredoxin
MAQDRNKKVRSKQVKNRFTLLGKMLIAFASVWSFSASHSAPSELLGSVAPDFVLRSVADGNVRLSEYRSDVVVLNFWSDWCGQCGRLMPVLNELNEQHKSSGLRVLSVDVDGEPDAAAKLAQELSLNFPLLLDAGQQVSRAYDLKRLPLTLLIDREGVVRLVQQGATGESPERLVAEVAAMLGE